MRLIRWPWEAVLQCFGGLELRLRRIYRSGRITMSRMAPVGVTTEPANKSRTRIYLTSASSCQGRHQLIFVCLLFPLSDHLD